MNLTIRHLKAFVAVAETGSFVEAADIMSCSQPALSVTVRNLEEEMGGRLFVRSTRSLVLTPEGAEFLPTAKRLIHDFGFAIQDVKNHLSMKRGRLALAVIPSFANGGLGPIMRHYKDKFPQIDVLLQDTITEDVVQNVQQGRVDFGLTFDPGPLQGLEFTPLFDDPYLALLPASHLLAKTFDGDARTLQEEDFIMLQAPSSVRHVILKEFEKASIPLKSIFECNQLASVGRMVAEGVGISIIPRLAQTHMEALGGICHPLIHPKISQSFGILKRTRYPLSKASVEFLNILKQTLLA